jgi:hypothetical protein
MQRDDSLYSFECIACHDIFKCEPAVRIDSELGICVKCHLHEESKTARKEHIVNDMGTGCCYCSNCDYTLGFDPFKTGDIEVCPHCNSVFTDENFWTSSGGSDF